MTQSIKDLCGTLSIIDSQHENALPLALCSVLPFIYNYAECHYTECRYAECRGALLE
jgi:hypothetical protein